MARKLQKHELIDLSDAAELRKLAPKDLKHDIGEILDRLRVDMVYAKANHDRNQFNIDNQPLYTPNAKMLIDKRIAKIILRFIDNLPDDLTVDVTDALRTVDAQAGMLAVKEANQWPDYLVSSPGQGAHPTGHAFDIVVKKAGNPIPVGVAFDDFMQLDASTGAELPMGVEGLPRASRKNPYITPEEKKNRVMVETAMQKGAMQEGTILMPLRDEDWDFRAPTNIERLWWVIESVARVIGIEDSLPPEPEKPIANYEAFKDLWGKYFGEHSGVLIQKLGRYSPPAEKDLIFVKDYEPLMDVDLEAMGFPPMTDGRFDAITKQEYANQKRAHYSGHPELQGNDISLTPSRGNMQPVLNAINDQMRRANIAPDSYEVRPIYFSGNTVGRHGTEAFYGFEISFEDTKAKMLAEALFAPLKKDKRLSALESGETKNAIARAHKDESHVFRFGAGSMEDLVDALNTGLLTKTNRLRSTQGRQP
ncbi:MAG: hypothetical protein EB060_08895 [Proteobacteria bacterium]|nr:hypothetical protein [Pseudomonadota bacterium]